MILVVLYTNKNDFLNSTMYILRILQCAFNERTFSVLFSDVNNRCIFTVSSCKHFCSVNSMPSWE